MIDAELEAQVLALGDGMYSHLRLLDGKLCGLGRYTFTCAIMVDMGRTIADAPCRRRYCYASKSDALSALNAWDGKGDPPGPWIKRKGLDGEALGPGALE